jgi:F420-0:gamma-glutamyl ligase-like protein
MKAKLKAIFRELSKVYIICRLLGWYWDDYIWKPLTNKIIQLKDRIFKNA